MRTITVTLPDDIADEVERLAGEEDWDGVKDLLAADVAACEVRDGRLNPLTDAGLKSSLEAAVAEADRDGWLEGETAMAKLIARYDGRAK